MNLKHYLVPHKGNDNLPHAINKENIWIAVATAVAVVFLSFMGTFVLTTTNFLAAIQTAFLVDLANEDRGDENLHSLTVNPRLVAAAQLKANDMAKKGYFAHTSPAGQDPWHWFEMAGYDFRYAGENLAVNFTDSEKAENAWMNSPTHRANILNTKFTEIGIAKARGTYKGNQTTFVVQMFGTPKTGPTIVTRAPEVDIENEIAKTVTVDPQNQVQGEQVEIEITESDILPEESSLVVVEGLSDQEVKEIAELNKTVTGEVVYTTAIERVIINPRSFGQTALVVLGAIIMFALVLKIIIEIRRHHLKHVLAAIGLLIFVAVLLYASEFLLFQDVIIL